MIKTVERPDMALPVFLNDLDMIKLAKTVATGALTVAVIEAGFVDRERKQITLSVTLRFDL